MNVSVVIPAAGTSTRMGGTVRKPFLPLAGEPILVRTCRAKAALPNVREIIVAAHPEDLPLIEGEWEGRLRAAGMTLAVAGGACRAESVWNALQVVSAEAEIVAVHDAARPFVSMDVAAALVSTAMRTGAAVPVVSLSDTVKRIEGDRVTETPRRTGLMRVQTPQVFRSDLLIDAYEYAIRTGGLTEAHVDDALVVEMFGGAVSAVLSDELTFKITTPRDVQLAEAVLAAGLAGDAPVQSDAGAKVGRAKASRSGPSRRQ